MRISTGLRPKTELQRIPERQNYAQAYHREVTVTVPIPDLKVREVWILTFQKVHYFSDGEVIEGDVLETMLSGTEPKIEKKSFTYGVADETPHKAEAEDHYRRQYNAPDDAQRQSHHYGNTQHTDVTVFWWEVVI